MWLKLFSEEPSEICPIDILIGPIFEGAMQPVCFSLSVDFDPIEPVRVTEFSCKNVLEKLI